MSEDIKYTSSAYVRKELLKNNVDDAANDAVKRFGSYGENNNKEIEIYEIKLIKKVKLVTGFQEVDLTKTKTSKTKKK